MPAREPFHSTAPSRQSVANTAGQIAGANASRAELIIVNVGTVPVLLALGQTPTASAYHVALTPCTTADDGTGGSFVCDYWTGAVQAIVASGTGAVCVTELTE